MNHVEILADGKANKIGNNFHIIRYILAVLVLYSHSYGLQKLPEPELFYCNLGSFAVKCFFALSGYLITLSCVRSAHLGNYLLNRFLRIAPALLVAVLFSLWLGHLFHNFEANPLPYSLNGPLWTLSWEILCYCICGGLWWFGFLNKNILSPVVIISWTLFIVLPRGSDVSMVVTPLFLLFFTGSLIALDEKQFRIKRSGLLFLLLLIGVLVDCKAGMLFWFFSKVPFLHGPDFSVRDYHTFAFLLGLPFALMWLALYVKPLIKLRNDYSYGMYIYGWPVQQALIAFFSPSPLILFVSTLAVTQGLAMLSWHLIEKRALMFKR
jgi:peptidoglycan/LPS O-acetylase OafA/YrhL